MRNLLSRVCFVVGLATALCHLGQQAEACTGVKLQAKDGALVYGRTMEFGMDLQSNPIVIPRRLALQGTAEGGKPGLAWQSKYAAVGLNAMGVNVIVDGTNEKGLAGGMFYLPGYAEYQRLAPGDESRTLGPWELVTWMLTSFATVDEVRSALPQIRVGAIAAPQMDVAPLHYVVHDLQGQSLVIEYLKGELHLYENRLGVITNAPEFSWHLTNLNNYVSLKALNDASVEIDGLKVQALGQGSGLFGLPGDYTPPSRFVRAVALGHTALKGDNGEQAVEQLFHVLDAFDIPLGAVEEIAAGKKAYEFTSWTSASDMKNHVFYFHTHDNRRVRRVELMKADLNANQVLTFYSQSSQDFDDLLPAATRN